MDDTEKIELSMREIDRLRVIRDVLDGRILQREAAEQLHRSPRQVRRLCRRVAVQGTYGIRHGLRGKPSNHQLAAGLREHALKLVAAHYYDFGPSFANEKLLVRFPDHTQPAFRRKPSHGSGPNPASVPEQTQPPFRGNTSHGGGRTNGCSLRPLRLS